MVMCNCQSAFTCLGRYLMHIDYDTFCELKENQHSKVCKSECNKSFCICDHVNIAILDLHTVLVKRGHLHFGCGQVCCQYIETREDLDKAIDYLARKKCLGVTREEEEEEEMVKLEERFSKLTV